MLPDLSPEQHGPLMAESRRDGVGLRYKYEYDRMIVVIFGFYGGKHEGKELSHHCRFNWLRTY